MGIKELKIQGFRTLKDITWTPGDLNIVIGANASGKSNLLAAIGLLPEIFKGRLADAFQEMGGVNNICWNRSAEHISLDCSYLDVVNAAFHYNLKLSIARERNDYIIEREICTENASDSNDKIDRNLDKITVTESNVTKKIDFNAAKVNLRESLLSWAGAFVFPKGILSYNVSPVDLKGVFDAPDSGRKSVIRESATTRNEDILRLDGSNLVNVLHTRYTSESEFKSWIDDAMAAAFPEYEALVFPPAGNSKIELSVKWKSLSYPEPAFSLSDGTLRFLFLLTALASDNVYNLICIDEPEIGLHPRMFNIIAEYAAEASRHAQVIFTTHSAEFLDAFREVENPTVTVAHLIDGETKLSIPDPERLAHWLKRYSLGELFTSNQLENLVAD